MYIDILNFGYQRSFNSEGIFLEIQLILLLEWKPHKFTAYRSNYEACRGIKRHTNYVINYIVL